MNVSLILTLIVQTTLSLVQVFIHSANFKVETCNFKNERICHYSLMKETVKSLQLSTSFQLNLKVCLKEFWKSVLLTVYPHPPRSIHVHPATSTSTQFYPSPASSFQPLPSSIHLHPAHFSLHPALCNTLNNIRTKISHVIGQFPQL